MLAARSTGVEPGASVWIRCEREVWRAGVVLSVEENGHAPGACVSVEVSSQVGCKERVLLHAQPEASGRPSAWVQRALDDEAAKDAKDLSLLAVLREPEVLHALQVRFHCGLVYTTTGPMLLAVNPFRNIPELYGADVLRRFADLEPGEEAPIPHVYGIARDAYEGVRGAGASQTVLISGESGAGKTETTKFVMRFLALAGTGGLEGTMSPVERRVLESIPLLEALGNASTLRNDNSSRFGKYVELQFGGGGLRGTRAVPRMVGAQTHTYLLEKVRVANVHEGERSFHVFYWVLAAAARARGRAEGVMPSGHLLMVDGDIELRGASELGAEGFAYLAQSSSRALPGRDEAASFDEMLLATRALGLSAAEISDLLAAVLAVLHLGNVAIRAPDGNSEGSEAACGGRADGPLTRAAGLLGVSAEDLEAVLCRQRVPAREAGAGGGTQRIRTVAQAEGCRDALARHLYGAIFTHAVGRVNAALSATGEAAGTQLPFIGVLDIFGFECFASNSFEQLCINFTNELLQQCFNEVIFEHEAALYKREGIHWDPQDFPDNRAIVELLSGCAPDLHSGIFPMLDEECSVPGGTSESWCRKLQACHGSSKLYQADKFGRGLFTVRHFAGPVEYQAGAFLAKNTDRLSADVFECMRGSSNGFIRQRFAESSLAFGAQVSEVSGKVVRARPYSVSSEFRRQLQDLMAKIRATSPHFVRCIKPNPQSLARSFDRASVVEQLRYQGVLQAMQVSRAGYQVRLRHREAFFEYWSLATRRQRAWLEGLMGRRDFSEAARALFEGLEVAPLGIPSGSVRVGKSLVFLKQEAAEVLNAAMRRRRHEAARQIQTRWRGFSCARWYAAVYVAALRLQVAARGLAARRQVEQLRRERAAVWLQRAWRARLARAVVARRRGAILVVLRWARAKCQRKRFVREVQLVRSLQRRVRQSLRAAVERRRLGAVHRIQRCWRGGLGRMRARTLQAARSRLAGLLLSLVQRWRRRVWVRVRTRLRDAAARGESFPKVEGPQARPGELIAAAEWLRGASAARAEEASALRRVCDDLVAQLAAAQIQVSWRRGSAARRRARRDAEMAQAALAIQARWRGALCSRAYTAARCAATQLQAAVRAQLARRRARVMRHEQDVAQLQSMLQGREARRIVQGWHRWAQARHHQGACSPTCGAGDSRSEIIPSLAGASSPHSSFTSALQSPTESAFQSPSQSLPWSPVASPVYRPAKVRTEEVHANSSPRQPVKRRSSSGAGLLVVSPATSLSTSVSYFGEAAAQESIDAMLAAAAAAGARQVSLNSVASSSSAGLPTLSAWRPAQHQQKAERLCRLTCWGLQQGRLPPSHPSAAKLALRKRRQAPRRSQYQKLVAEAEGVLPTAIADKIRTDAQRTFHVLPQPQGLWGWPGAVEACGSQEHPQERALVRILLAYEWRATKMTETRDVAAANGLEAYSYVAGANLLAAMCLGFVRGREEDGFWLFAHVIEDILGTEYFARTPSLLGFQGDRAAALALVTSEAPLAAAALGAQGLSKLVSLLAQRCLLSGFVGCLADEPLIAFWEQLLESRCSIYPRLPQLAWLAGLVRLAEGNLVRLAERNLVDLAGAVPQGGTATACFQQVIHTGLSLPDGARPGLTVPEARVRELRTLAEEPLLPFLGR